MRFDFISIRAFRSSMATIINEVLTTRKTFYITRRGRIVAELRFIPEGRRRSLVIAKKEREKPFKFPNWRPQYHD